MGLIPNSTFALDDALGSYLEYLYQEGDPLGYAGDAISGLQHFLPMLKRQLPTACRIFGAWRKSEIPAQAPPFPDLVLAGLVGLSLHLGLDGLAAALAVAFHCYLRTGEVLGMRCSQLALSHGRGAVVLPQTKKSIRDNVSITDRHVAAVCQRRLAAGAPGDRLVACSAAQALALLKLLLHFFGLEGHGFRWYSCRRGGATSDFRPHGLMEKILVRGRWESSRTARIYVTDGVRALLEARLSGEQQRDLHFFAGLWLST